jgi:hypothetical protein
MTNFRTDGDCTAKALAKPRCPNEDWVLWGINGNLDSGGWCCLPGQNGKYVNIEGGSYGVACFAPSAMGVSAGWQVASTVSTVSCVAGTSLPSTMTSSESLSTPTSGGDAQASEGAETGNGGDNSSSLSSGAIAGIVIGALAGVGLVLAGVFLVCKRRKGTKAIAGTYGELMEKSAQQDQVAVPVEMDAVGPVVELEGTGVPVGNR